MNATVSLAVDRMTRRCTGKTAPTTVTGRPRSVVASRTTNMEAGSGKRRIRSVAGHCRGVHPTATATTWNTRVCSEKHPRRKTGTAGGCGQVIGRWVIGRLRSDEVRHGP
jgi:hypothetical protein